MRIKDIATFQNGFAFKSKDFIRNGKYKVIKIKELKDGNIRFFSDSATVNIENIEDYEKFLVQKGDILFALTGDPVNKNNPLSWVGRTAVYSYDEPSLLNQRVCKLLPVKAINAKYIYYYFRDFNNFFALASIAKGSASQANISTKDIENIEINMPPLEVQNRIVDILDCISNKITKNEEINSNLEQQIQLLFNKMFAVQIADVKAHCNQALGELVVSIDNRGKTPPLESSATEYPIIDVRALSGTSRIIDFNNCTKYVSDETYFTWFRSGHPKPKDILISTVGSLAEMKMFFGSKGCIAQNVVALRTKGISAYYLYQYLLTIKKDLLAYNIGSVQPSIKVTHIINHPIYIPDKEEMRIFDSFASCLTDTIYCNSLEIDSLMALRNTLLPKLMSGEIDISDIDL